MYRIELSASEIVHRGDAIRKLMSVLLSDPASQKKAPKTTISCISASNPQQHYILGTFDGTKPSNYYREWRFSSYNQDFKCMYFEEWIPSDQTRKSWLLNQACFSLFRTMRRTRTEKEILALHCEPMEANNTRHALYKQGPHLHVSLAEQPIPHSHFALNHRQLSQIMTDINTLSSAMQEALKMIHDQVINTPAKEWKDA